MRVVHPSSVKVLWALVAASLVTATPALLAGIWAIWIYPIVLIVTFCHAMLLGAPLYYLLRGRIRTGWVGAMIAGAAIGAMPYSLWSLWLFLTFPGHQVPAVEWWNQSWPTLLFLGGMGIVGGVVFRAVLGAPQIEPEVDPAVFE